MSSVSLKNTGTVLLLCLASFTLGRFLVLFEPDHWFTFDSVLNFSPVSRLNAAKLKSNYLHKEREIGSSESDIDNFKEKIPAFDSEIKQNVKPEETIYKARFAKHAENIPGLHSEVDENRNADQVKEAVVNHRASIIENVDDKDETAIVEPEAAIVEPEAAFVEPEAAFVEPEAAFVEPKVAIAKGDTSITKNKTGIAKNKTGIAIGEKAVVKDVSKTKPVTNTTNNVRRGGRYSITPANLLGNALRFMSPYIKASFANITGIKYNRQKAMVMWPNFTDQKKWAVLTAGMRKLGYEQRLPTVVCLGVKKAGTTAFLYYLTKHPQVARALLDEVHYFSIDYEKGIDYYRSRMGFTSRNMVQFEKSPSYFVFQNVPQRMLKDLPPNVKFVVCVRDPVERTISDFRHEYELKLNRDPSGAINETPTTQAKHFVEKIFHRNGEVQLSSGIASESVYSLHFKDWLQFFPRDRFYILSHERVIKDLYGELKNLEKFLGLRLFYKRSMFYYDKNRQAPCMRSGCPRTSTPGFLPKADLSPNVIQKLRDFFRPYNQEFEQLTQMNFSWTNL